jgi:hypothetical protein
MPAEFEFLFSFSFEAMEVKKFWKKLVRGLAKRLLLLAPAAAAAARALSPPGPLLSAPV